MISPQREIYIYPVYIISVVTLNLTQNRVLQSTRVIKNIRMGKLGNTGHYHIAVNTAASFCKCTFLKVSSSLKPYRMFWHVLSGANGPPREHFTILEPIISIHRVYSLTERRHTSWRSHQLMPG